jgi:hypothetical protein
MSSEISNFRGDYWFLSNFFPCKLAFGGKIYESAEHLYQASKATNDADHEFVRNAMSAAKAKRAGGRIAIRDDWEEVKEGIMLDILRQKFSSPTLKSRLLDTGDTQLVEENSWGDVEWGCVTVDGRREGKNLLGKLLMRVREECQG